jgi:hypothetical protein
MWTVLADQWHAFMKSIWVPEKEERWVTVSFSVKTLLYAARWFFSKMGNITAITLASGRSSAIDRQLQRNLIRQKTAVLRVLKGIITPSARLAFLSVICLHIRKLRASEVRRVCLSTRCRCLRHPCDMRSLSCLPAVLCDMQNHGSA